MSSKDCKRVKTNSGGKSAEKENGRKNSDDLKALSSLVSLDDKIKEHEAAWGQYDKTRAKVARIDSLPFALLNEKNRDIQRAFSEDWIHPRYSPRARKSGDGKCDYGPRLEQVWRKQRESLASIAEDNCDEVGSMCKSRSSSGDEMDKENMKPT